VRLHDIDFDAVFSSPRRRALQTAELAGFASTIQTELLAEVDYGEYEGLTTAQIRNRRPDWELWRDGCPAGESPLQVAERARRVLARLQGDGQANVLVFSHGHFLRALATQFLGLQVESAARLSLDTASLSILRTGDRGHLLQLWNLT
jgi:probable phosphoglycerate mutase